MNNTYLTIKQSTLTAIVLLAGISNSDASYVSTEEQLNLEIMRNEYAIVSIEEQLNLQKMRNEYAIIRDKQDLRLLKIEEEELERSKERSYILEALVNSNTYYLEEKEVNIKREEREHKKELTQKPPKGGILSWFSKKRPTDLGEPTAKTVVKARGETVDDNDGAKSIHALLEAERAQNAAAFAALEKKHAASMATLKAELDAKERENYELKAFIREEQKANSNLKTWTGSIASYFIDEETVKSAGRKIGYTYGEKEVQALNGEK